MNAIPKFRSRRLCPEPTFATGLTGMPYFRDVVIDFTQTGQRVMNIAVVVHLQRTHPAVIDGRHMARPTGFHLGLDMGRNIQRTKTNDLLSKLHNTSNNQNKPLF